MQQLDASPVTELIGRASELATADRFLHRHGTRPTALVIAGEAGIGKTTLYQACIQLAESAGLRVFAAAPSAGERELPYAGLGDLLADCRNSTIDSLPGAQRTAIDVARAGGVRGGVEEHALVRGVLELLRIEGADGKLLLAVDDAQWLDRPTAAALTFALRRLGSVPVRVLVTVRTEHGKPALMPLGLSCWSDAECVVVGAMSATEVGSLIRSHLGRQLSRPQLEDITRTSSGNPMFAIELARDGSTQSSALSAVLAARLRALDADTRAVLQFAAAALRPSSDLLVRAGVTPAQLRSAVDQGLVELGPGRLALAHPLLGEVAYGLLLPEERLQHHALLAQAGADSVERGHHIALSTAEPEEAAAHSLDQAADDAASRGDHAGAAGFLLSRGRAVPR